MRKKGKRSKRRSSPTNASGAELTAIPGVQRLRAGFEEAIALILDVWHNAIEKAILHPRRLAHDENDAAPAPMTAIANDSKLTPFWDKNAHELWAGKTRVIRYTQPAPCQEAVLSELQSLGWPRALLNVLSSTPGQPASQRLHHVAGKLNAAQDPHLIHFFVNDKGRSIHWEFVGARNQQIEKPV